MSVLCIDYYRVRRKGYKMEIILAVLFGIVEGITEWLPVSSTGHMILLNEIFPLQVGEDPEAFYSMFEVVIQLGAILAVVVCFWNKIWPFGKKNNTDPMVFSKTTDIGRKMQWFNGIGQYVKWNVVELWLHILVSCVPAAVIGLLFDEVFERLFYNYTVVAIMLIVFGVAFILMENWNKGRHAKIRTMTQITYEVALLIGFFQLIAAIFPGTSRSGATIVGALLIGVSRKVAAEYTFYLAIPVMFGASLLKLIKFGLSFTVLEAVVLLVGMLVAFVVSIVIIRFLMEYIRKHDFKVFGWYRIVLGAVVLICGICGVIGG